MSDRVRIQVEATDNASDDFQRIGTNAARMGQQVTQAGRSASQGLKPIDQGAKQAQTALVALEREAAKMPTTMSRVGTAAKNNATTFAAMGAAATTLAGFLSDAARAAAEEEAIFARLETAVEATGESYADYAVQIEQAIDASERLSFSDDQAAAALANLTATTGDAAEALDLLGLAQDLARGKGIELAAAANIVGRVAEGNTGILARYGIAIQEGASAQEALAAVQERYAGQAQAYADTTAGAYDRVKNTINNFVESIGSGTGDLQLMLTLLPGVSAGFTLVGGAAGLALKGVQSLRAASALATVALGPVGLALAATSAVVAIGAMTDWFGLAADGASDYEEAVKSAQAATKLLDDTVYGLRSDSESFLNAQEIQAELREVTTALGIYSDRYEEFVKFRDDHPGWTDEEIRQQWGILRGEDMLPMLDRLGATGEQIERIATVTNDLVGRFDDAGVNTRLLATDLDGLFDSFQSGEINAQQFVAELDRMQSGFNETYVTVDQLTAAMTRLERVRAQMAGTRTSGIIDPNEGTGLPDAGAQAERNAAVRESIQLINEQGSALGDIKIQSNEYAQALDAANQAMIDFVGTGENIIDVLIRAGGTLTGNQGFLRGVRELTDAKGALDSTFQTIIGGSEALAQSGQAVADWASELTGITLTAEGFAYEIAAVDEALASGRITQEEYNAAIVAGQDILWNNALIQKDVAAIQAQQAPLIADRTNAYQDQIAALAALEPAEQRHALLMMDSGIQAEVATAYSTAYAASLGEIPPEVASELILAEAASNPDLAVLLEELGLVARDHEGNLVVNFPDGPSLTDTLTDLNSTIDELVAAIHELNGTTISPNIDQAAMDALLKIGEYNKGGPIMGDGTGGPYGSGGGGNAREGGGEQPPKTQTVTITANAEPYFRVSSDVQANAALLAGTDTQLLVSADGTQAISVFRDIEGAVVAISDGEHIVSVTGDTADASNDIAVINEALNALNGTEGVVYVKGDESDAVASVDNASARRDAFDGTSGTVTFYGDESGAVGAANNAAGARNSVDGTSGTIYINGDASGAMAAFNAVNGLVGYATVYIQGVRGTGFQDLAMRDGGIVGYDAAALDGIVTHGGYRTLMVGEAGREILRVPPGSSVTPAPMTNALTGGSGGGKEVHLHFHNAVYGFDDFQQQVAQGVRSAMYQGQYQ
jgi:hypothetical protein